MDRTGKCRFYAGSWILRWTVSTDKGDTWYGIEGTVGTDCR